MTDWPTASGGESTGQLWAIGFVSQLIYCVPINAVLLRSMPWVNQPAVKQSSIGCYQLPFHWVRDKRHCTLEGAVVSGHSFSFLCHGSSSAWTQGCCLSWFVKRRAPEVKSCQYFPNEESSTSCKTPKESLSCQIPDSGLWHPLCNPKALCKL